MSGSSTATLSCVSPVDGRIYVERARHMIDIADQALATLVPSPLPGFDQSIHRKHLDH